ncbi:killer cell lectin-like receptor subfamily B member 1B allele C [Carettochelys insculpta]|uniref:killer cell lectin-like receptor subfamily B member 1B allele C n=1 Tax=Carettochelys insculpta TaxID=44489 RepID=UPI003EBCB68C
MCPQWHRTALWAGWIGNILLMIAVIALGVFPLVSKKGPNSAAPGSDGTSSRDTAAAPGSTTDSSAHLERVRSQLCLPAQPGPAGGSGCKLCPMDWRLHRDKCYRDGKGLKTWNESRSDCARRDSQLPVIQDQEELESLFSLTQRGDQIWVGLSRPSPGENWTWLDGSRLDQSLLPVPDQAEGSSCGTMQGNQLLSETCGAAFNWVCQREAVLL